MSENVKQIIQTHLTKIGADGLSDLCGCACELKNATDCLKIVCNCVPGYKHPDGKIHPTKPIPKNDLFGELKE